MRRPALAALLCLLAGAAQARPYAVDITAADENELRQLYYDGLIDEEELESLLLLLESPVDLNAATTIEIYQLPTITADDAEAIVAERDLHGAFLSLAELAARVPTLTPGAIAAIDAFTNLRMPGQKPVRGTVAFLATKTFDGVRPVEDDRPGLSKSAAQLGYGKMPAMALSLGLDVADWLDVGLGLSVQEGIKAVRYDPASRDLQAAWGLPLFRPYLGYARVVRPKGEVVLGHYHLRLGQGLTMATTSGTGREGAFVRQSALRGEDRIKPFDGLLGAVVRAKKLGMGRANGELTGFVSARPYDVYAPYLAVGDGRPSDVTSDVALDSMRVWVDGQRLAYATIPNAVGVVMGGGSAGLTVARRSGVGVTGYGAWLNRRAIPGISDPYSIVYRQRWPSGQGFGAVGVHGTFGVSLLDLAGEASLFFGGGEPGLGLFLWGRIAPAWGEFVWVLRHYDRRFANPFARATAAADMLAGLRARNEDGVRLRLLLEPHKTISVRLQGDLSRNISADVHDLALEASLRAQPTKWLRAGFRLAGANQNLQVNGRDQLYGGELDPAGLLAYLGGEEDADTTFDRAGERWTWQAWVAPGTDKIGRIELRYGQALIDNHKKHDRGSSCVEDFQLSHRARLQGMLRAGKTTTLRGALAWYDDDAQGGRTAGGVDGATALNAYLQLDQNIKDIVRFSLRGGLGRRLPSAPGRCDGQAVGDPPVDDPAYAPTAWDLRHFGEFLATMAVRF